MIKPIVKVGAAPSKVESEKQSLKGIQFENADGMIVINDTVVSKCEDKLDTLTEAYGKTITMNWYVKKESIKRVSLVGVVCS